MFRLFECCALSFFERFVLSFSLKIERFVSDSAEIWICGLYMKREEFFITTKLWVQDYEYDDALRAFDLSMKKLGLDYLDLYLMHKPYGNYRGYS